MQQNITSPIRLQAQVKGMHCAACSSRIERVLSGEEGVVSVSVNLAQESMDLAYDPALISPEAVAQKVKGLGFELVLPEAESAGGTLELGIKGMHCAACSSRIERVVGSMEGVSKASVNLPGESGSFAFDPAVVSPTDIRKAIHDLGFAPEAAPSAASMFEERQREARERLAEMKQRLIPAFAFALPLLILSMGHMFGMPLPAFLDPAHAPLNFALAQLALTLPVVWSGRNFYLQGFPALARRTPNMDSLIAVGTGAAIVYSLWNTAEIAAGIDAFAKAHDLYFESAAVLIALISLGKYFEARSKLKTTGAIRALMELSPERAVRLRDGEPEEIPADDVVPGDMLLIRPGSRVPVDAVVVSGRSSVDESMLTGESMPVTKEEGSKVTGGTLNANGTLTVRAERVGQDTTLSQIIRMVQQAQGSKAPIANLADTISYYFVPTVMALALLAGLGWYFIGDAGFTFSLRIFIAVLVIACPCAMGLATPTSIMVGTGRGAQLGVLVKTGEALQKAESVRAVVFDKTGTLTYGRPELTAIHTFSALPEEDALRLAACAEQGSEHPLAQAIVRAAQEKGLALKGPDSFEAVPGLGLRASVGGKDVLIGNQRFMEESGVTWDSGSDVESTADALSEEGQTALFMAADGEFAAILAVADTLKPEAPEVVSRLESMGIRVAMLTGDNERTARAIAAKAGIGKVIAGVMPERKAAEVERLQSEGYSVAMIGDGINDAPALARADLGVAMGSGIDVAVESGDMVLMGGELSHVITGLALSRAVMRNIRQNLFWAFAYNVVGIPVAMGVLHIFGGPTLNPMIAGIAMAMSSVSVVTNALRLRFFKA